MQMTIGVGRDYWYDVIRDSIHAAQPLSLSPYVSVAVLPWRDAYVHPYSLKNLIKFRVLFFFII